MKKKFENKKILETLKILSYWLLLILIVAIVPWIERFWNANAPINIGHPQKGDFVKVGKMSVPRYDHQAILLDDGQVLIYGGAETAATPELYNPETKKFRPVGQLIKRGGFFNPVKLNNGKILLTGGCNGYWHKATQLYDPNAEVFKKGPDMKISRGDHAATLLQDGRVLITGGGFRFANESEIYDPKTDKFTIAAKMNKSRFKHSAVLLNDGRVLIVGGADRKGKLASAEIYDPKTNKYKIVGNMNFQRTNPNLYLLKNGNVLITEAFKREIEIFNPKTSEFKIVSTHYSLSECPSEVLLANDKILFTGGSSGVGLSLTYYKSSEIYDPETNNFTKCKDMNFFRAGHRMTLLKDGNVLITGSDGTGRTAELYIYEDKSSQ